jgi:hypothetical protein
MGLKSGGAGGIFFEFLEALSESIALGVVGVFFCACDNGTLRTVADRDVPLPRRLMSASDGFLIELLFNGSPFSIEICLAISVSLIAAILLLENGEGNAVFVSSWFFLLVPTPFFTSLSTSMACSRQ